MCARVKLTNKVETTINTQSLEIDVPEGQVVHIGDKRIFFNNGSFTTIFQEPLKKILELDLNKQELKVLLYAIADCKTDNTIETNSEVVSKAMGIHSSHVRSAIKSLKQKNIIVEEDGQALLNLTKFSKVNYHLAYSGKHNKYADVVDEHPLITDDDGNPVIRQRKQIRKPQVKCLKLPPNKEND
jgi:hypothetical protein